MCMDVHHTPTWHPRRPEEGAESSETRATDSCEPSCRCWELNPVPPQEQQILLTAESSLQPNIFVLKYKNNTDKFEQNFNKKFLRKRKCGIYTQCRLFSHKGK